jgi:hypothetical protein
MQLGTGAISYVQFNNRVGSLLYPSEVRDTVRLRCDNVAAAVCTMSETHIVTLNASGSPRRAARALRSVAGRAPRRRHWQIGWK